MHCAPCVCHFKLYINGTIFCHLQDQSEWNTAINDMPFALALHPCPFALAPAVVPSVLVAWKLKGCTVEAFPVAGGVCQSGSQHKFNELQGGPDGSEPRYWPNRLSRGALICWTISLLGNCWETHHEKERESSKYVSVRVTDPHACFICDVACI